MVPTPPSRESVYPANALSCASAQADPLLAMIAIVDADVVSEKFFIPKCPYAQIIKIL
jgi:hypothetical protein